MNPGSTAELDEIARIRDTAPMLLEAAEDVIRDLDYSKGRFVSLASDNKLRRAARAARGED